MTQRRPPGRFDSRDYAGPTRLTRRGRISGSGSARLDLSQKGDLPSSGERQSSFGPRSPARAKGATASSIFKIIYKDKQGDDLEEMISDRPPTGRLSATCVFLRKRPCRHCFATSRICSLIKESRAVGEFFALARLGAVLVCDMRRPRRRNGDSEKSFRALMD